MKHLKHHWKKYLLGIIIVFVLKALDKRYAGMVLQPFFSEVEM